MDNTQTREPYIVLSKRSTPLEFRPVTRVRNFNHLIKGALYAIDIETNGLSCFRDDAKILCIAIAGSDGVFVLDTRSLSRAELRRACLALCNVRLVAHNLLFDSTWLEHLLNLNLNYIACTYVMFKLCANEGWEGQSWSLDAANEHILNTARNNKTTLMDLLTTHRIPKSRMYELADVAPTEFMEYCGNDAESAYELYYELIKQFDAKFGEGCLEHWYSLWHNELQLLREQQLRGLMIDATTVQNYLANLYTELSNLKTSILNHPAILEVSAELKQEAVNELVSKEPPKRDLIQEHLQREPPNRTASGAISKRWEQWYHKLKELQALTHPYNKSWVTWHERYTALVNTPCDQWFNLNSLPHLKKVFFDKLNFTPSKVTDTGEPSLDNKALRFLGELGIKLVTYRDVMKEIGYVQSCIDNINTNNILRPGFKIFGTITGRVAGGGV